MMEGGFTHVLATPWMGVGLLGLLPSPIDRQAECALRREEGHTLSLLLCRCQEGFSHPALRLAFLSWAVSSLHCCRWAQRKQLRGLWDCD